MLNYKNGLKVTLIGSLRSWPVYSDFRVSVGSNYYRDDAVVCNIELMALISSRPDFYRAGPY